MDVGIIPGDSCDEPRTVGYVGIVIEDDACRDEGKGNAGENTSTLLGMTTADGDGLDRRKARRGIGAITRGSGRLLRRYEVWLGTMMS